MCDLIIAGAGPAGLTAALYALRSGANVTLIEQGSPGGQLLKTKKIYNYPGFANGILGMELATNMFQQISSYNNLKLEIQTVISIKKEINKIIITTSNGNSIEGHTLILAMGGNPKLLNILGEIEYTGKGVSYCAICDGFFFKDKITTVIGGGGIPVIEDKGILTGVEAVIDKDLASSLLAKKLSADYLVIATDVSHVAINFGKPNQENLKTIDIKTAQKYLDEGQFGAGSMGPKVKAIMSFVEHGGKGIITSLDSLTDSVIGCAGTKIVK